jgi:hypothetical protein
LADLNGGRLNGLSKIKAFWADSMIAIPPRCNRNEGLEFHAVERNALERHYCDVPAARFRRSSSFV